MIISVRSRGKKMSNEVWEMINPDYINPMYSPSPSDRSVSPGRFSTASSNAYAPSPWTTVLRFNSPEVPHSPSVRCVASMVKPGGQIYSISITADGLLYTGSNSKSIRVWRHPDFAQHSCLKSGSGNVKAMLVAGDKILSAHGDNKIRLWRRSRSNPNVHTRLATLPKLNRFHNFSGPS